MLLSLASFFLQIPSYSITRLSFLRGALICHILWGTELLWPFSCTHLHPGWVLPPAPRWVIHLPWGVVIAHLLNCHPHESFQGRDWNLLLFLSPVCLNCRKQSIHWWMDNWIDMAVHNLQSARLLILSIPHCQGILFRRWGVGKISKFRKFSRSRHYIKMQCVMIGSGSIYKCMLLI